jgi:RND family efflux transporter MFP subunit
MMIPPIPLFVCLCLALLAGCGKPAGLVAEAPRAVKVERVEAAGSSGIEIFAGTLRAKQRAELGFEPGGRIATLSVDVGDSVKAGQVLATLDPAPAQQRLNKAEADRAAAAASFAEREALLRRIRLLQRDQIVAEAQLEDVRLQRDASAAQLKAAEAGLALARRDLAMSRILAPFAGRIVARAALPAMDVAPGRTVLELDGGAERELVVWLPAELVARLRVGDKARLADTGAGASARLEKISGHADNGSLVQAVFHIEDAAARLRPGAAVKLELPSAARASISIPASALLPESHPGQGVVYIFDAAMKRVSARRVRVEAELARDGRLAVASGLKPGEWVVVAGPAFLTDGQAATAFEPETRLAQTLR